MSLHCNIEGAATVIVLDLPDNGNRLSNQAALQITDFIDGAKTSHLIVIKSVGPDFCLGRDLGAAMSGPSGRTALDVRDQNTEPVLELLASIRRSRAPVMAVVQGRAIGLGTGLAAACDLTLAAEDATFQLPEMGHGIPPCLAMSGLIGHVPSKAILQLVYSTETIGAVEAKMLGIVGQVVPLVELQRRVEYLMGAIAAQSFAAVRAVKEYMRSAPRMDAQGAADFGSNLLAGVLSSAAPH